MYLSPGAVGGLFRQCAEVSGHGSRLVFTYLEMRRDGLPDAGPGTWLWLRVLKAGGEPWLWSVRSIDLEGFLREYGWGKDLGQTIGSGRKGIEFFGVAVR